MIPDFEKRMNDKMEQASLKDLMPDFDKEQEWQHLSQRLLPTGRKLHIPIWAYAAALLVLVSIGGAIWYLSADSSQAIASHSSTSSSPVAITEPVLKDTVQTNTTLAPDTLPTSKTAIAVIKKPAPAHKISGITGSGIIYNSTPCPIELRISQMMSCPNNPAKAISSCSTLEPDQSAELNYKESNKIARNCSLTVNEIEIKSIATGEVILLNANSTPSTAQEVFSYITREKKGDVLAGVFNYDCEKKIRKHGLKLKNHDGNLILE